MSRHDELDGAISDWTTKYDHNEATAILQRAGVPAGPVLANWELLSNPHLHARGFYVPVEHPDMGVFPYPGNAVEAVGDARPDQSRLTPLWAAHPSGIPGPPRPRRGGVETPVRRVDHRRRAAPRPAGTDHTLPPNMTRSPRTPSPPTKPAPTSASQRSNPPCLRKLRSSGLQ